MTTPAEYDVIVIGAGAIGENVADRTAQGGMRTVIVKAELVGGECSYWACMPSKALLRSAAALRAAQRVGGAHEAVTGALDQTTVLKRRDVMTSAWKDDGQVDWLTSAGIDLVRGRATITAPREVTVTDEDGAVSVLTAKHAARYARARPHCCRTSPGCATPGRGPAATRRAQSGFRRRSRSSVAGWSARRWRPRTPDSVPRSTSSPAAASSAGTNRSPARRWPPPCANSARPCTWTRRPPRSSAATAAGSVSSWTTAPPSRRMSCSSRPAMSPAPAVSGCTPSASKTETGWLSTTACASWTSTASPSRRAGSTASATSTTARCSPTRASTRPAPPATRSRRGRRAATSPSRRGALSPRRPITEPSPQVTFTDPEVASAGLTASAAKKAG